VNREKVHWRIKERIVDLAAINRTIDLGIVTECSSAQRRNEITPFFLSHVRPFRTHSYVSFLFYQHLETKNVLVR